MVSGTRSSSWVARNLQARGHITFAEQVSTNKADGKATWENQHGSFHLQACIHISNHTCEYACVPRHMGLYAWMYIYQPVSNVCMHAIRRYLCILTFACFELDFRPLLLGTPGKRYQAPKTKPHRAGRPNPTSRPPPPPQKKKKTKKKKIINKP